VLENQPFKKPLKVKIFIFEFYCDFCLWDDKVELSTGFGPVFSKSVK
jgi:hypothetical protein